MTHRYSEIAAVVLTVLGCAVAALGPFVYESQAMHAGASDDVRVVTLTGVAAAGVFTEEEVHAANYWADSFAPARPVIAVGRPLRLRLKSSDVVHSFYCPGLRIGPLKVYPGQVAEISLTPRVAGVYEYYCTTFCGEPHFGMRGSFVVQDESGKPAPPAIESREEFWKQPPVSPTSTRVQRGEALYRRMGCQACHGVAGRGGVSNYNYVNDTVPALNTLAERLMLFEPEDVEAIVSEIDAGTELARLVDDPPVPRFNVVLAQYNSVRDVIHRGNPPGKKDPGGPQPPLEMPAWGQRLSDPDIESIIAYLLTLQPWNEEDEEEEEGEQEEDP